MLREQKTGKTGCPCKGMLETKSSKGARSIAKLENEEKNNVNNLLEKILERNNLNQAYLKVVKKKGAAGVDGIKFLGFSLHKVVNKIGIRPHQKNNSKVQKQIKELTRRSRGRSIKQIFLELKRYTVGWLGYYALAEMKTKVKELNQWIRRRIRMYIWKQSNARFRNLKQLGLPRAKAWEYANTRLGYWRIAGSPILHRTLTDKYLVTIGYDDITKRYEALHLNH